MPFLVFFNPFNGVFNYFLLSVILLNIKKKIFLSYLIFSTHFMVSFSYSRIFITMKLLTFLHIINSFFATQE